MKGRISFLRHLLIIFFIALLSNCSILKKSIKTKGHKISSQKEIQNKYSEAIKVEPEKISTLPLYSFIDQWYGAAYKYGGKSMQGVDCSGFASILYKEIYNKEISGSSENIFDKCNSLQKDELKEGDFVFFKIDHDKISHVGVYLQNNKFVHATTKAGVIISDLNEDYYKKYYFSGGRLK